MTIATLLSTVRTGTDLDGFAAVLRPSDAQVTVTGRGPFTADISRVEFHDLWLQRATTSSAWINDARISPNRHGIIFATGRAPALIWRGEPLEDTDIGLRGGGQDFCVAFPTNSHWGAMSLPIESITRIFPALTGADAPSPNTLTIRTTPSAMARLRQLHDAAGHLAEHAPAGVNAAAVRGLEHALTEAMIDCLAGLATRDDRAAAGRYDTIMKRLHAVLHARGEDEVYLTDLCESVGVSARTLRACCLQYLGMGPKRLLMLRRMHRARRVLQNAAVTTSVTEIATSFGFWELGRFSVEYRRLFGESPSVTLRRPRH